MGMKFAASLGVKATLLEEMLGTKAKAPSLFVPYVLKDCPEELREEEQENAEATAELDEVKALEDRSTTIFHRVDGKVGIYNYQIKGFFKDSCQSLRKADGTASKGLTAFKKVIDGLIFVDPRFIFIQLPEGAELGICERPLRVDTPKGPRVALARSETVPAGSTLEFTVNMLSKDHLKYVEEWLNYGELKGLAQWRNSGKGIFTWEAIA